MYRSENKLIKKKKEESQGRKRDKWFLLQGDKIYVYLYATSLLSFIQIILNYFVFFCIIYIIYLQY